MGVDIFPATGKPKPQSSVTVPTSESKVFAATDILELVKQAGNEVTVVGEVVNIHYISNNNQKIFLIHFIDVLTSINEYSSFYIEILSEGLINLVKSRNITVNQIQNWQGKYIKVRGVLEFYQRTHFTTPQIIIHNPNQISVISKAEADTLLAVPL